MLEYAAKMTHEHHLATQEDVQRLRDVGFADADILHIIYWIAHFNMANTLADCVGREVHENMTAVFVDDLPKENGTLGTGAGAMIRRETLRVGMEQAQVRALEGLTLDWINSPPLTWSHVRGRVLLVTSWDATHPNSLAAVPYLSRWHSMFAARGLTVLAVHAAEFPQAKDAAWAREEIGRLGIRYPVALDPTFRRVSGSNNRYWPATHVIDREGFVRFRQYGPGGFETMEAQIEDLLEPDPAPATSVPKAAVRPDIDLDGGAWVHPDASPELYATFYIGARGGIDGKVNEVHTYSIPKEQEPHRLYVGGDWIRREDGLELAAGTGQCAFQYRAHSVYMFASPGTGDAMVQVRLDGASVPPHHAGADVNEQSQVRVDSPRAYCLITHREFRAHTLELETLDAGVIVHRFSFLPFRGEVDD